MSKWVLDPELEDYYQRYVAAAEQMGSSDAMATVLLGDAVYARPFKMPKWSSLVTMLREPKVAVRYAHQIGISPSRADHTEQADLLWRSAELFEAAWSNLYDAAVREYGDSGPLISGVGRSHFPKELAERLRFLAHGEQMLKDAYHLHEKLSKSRSAYFTD